MSTDLGNNNMQDVADLDKFGYKQELRRCLPLTFLVFYGFAYMAPVLGIVFQTSQTNYLLAIVFLFAFSMGHCSVIVSAGTLTGKVQKYLNWSQSSKTILIIKKICGLLVIMGGIYLVYVTL